MTSLKRLLYLIPAILLILAIFLLHSQLQTINFLEFRQELQNWKILNICIALILTFLNFIILACYDLIGLKQIKISIPFFQVFTISFEAFSLSNIVGHSLFSGTSVRLRSYSKLGLSIPQITRISVQNTITFWIGFIFLTGISLLYFPEDVSFWGFPTWSSDVVGIIFLAVVIFFLFACSKWKSRHLHYKHIEISLPDFKGGLTDLILSSIDIFLCSGIFYILLPSETHLSFFHFLAFFLLAHLAGLISQIPGGLGILDGILLKLLSPYGNPHEILVTIVLYRSIYYLLPLFITSTATLGSALWMRRFLFIKTAQISKVVIEPLVPQVLALLTFIGGVVLLISGVTPSLEYRMQVITSMLPLAIIELSHITTIITGLTLVVLAKEIRRKNQGAFRILLISLIIGIFASLFKGLDWEEALILSGILFGLLPFKDVFYRKAPLFAERGLSWSDFALAAILIITITIGFFAYTNIPYAHHLWWTFAPNADASRFLRATLILASIFFFFIVKKYTKGPRIIIAPTSAEDMEEVKKILPLINDTEAQLAFLDDKKIKLAQDKKSFLMFGIQGNSWIVLGDVYGESMSAKKLLHNFLDEADELGVQVIFYQSQEEFIPRLLEQGLQVFKLGEEAHISLSEFTLEGSSRKPLRNAQSRGIREGYTFEVWSKEKVSQNIEQLKRISDSWLTQKKSREKGFSLGFFSENYIQNFSCAVIVKDQLPIAFANIWQGNNIELSVDMMRYDVKNSPSGIMDFLFVSILLWGKDQGFQSFNLGMAPLSGIRATPWGPLWYKIANIVFNHGEQFYNFQGLREYKEKFNPIWKSRFVATDGNISFAQALTNVALLISGGLRGILKKTK